MSDSIMEQMVAYLRKTTLASPQTLPDEHLPLLARAKLHFSHGQFSLATSTVLRIPNQYLHLAPVVILRVRILLAQGYFHKAVRLLKENIGRLDAKKEQAQGGLGAGLDAAEKMQRDVWRLWVRLCEKDEEGEGEDSSHDTTELAFTAWKEYCEWTKMESYSELHNLLYEITHQLGVGTCNLPVREWIANTDSLISIHMDAQDFYAALDILRVRNLVTEPRDATFTNLMLEYFPMLEEHLEGPMHSELKLVEARTRMILHDIYVLAGNYPAALEKLAEIEECIRVDVERNKEVGRSPSRASDRTSSTTTTTTDLVGGSANDPFKLTSDVGTRAWDLRWLVRFHKVEAPGKLTGMSDDDRLAKLSSLAHEAVNRDIPRFKMLATALQAKIMLGSLSKHFDEFFGKENEFLQAGVTYGMTAVEWRGHLRHHLFTNFPPPDHPKAEAFIERFQEIMDQVDWNPGQGINNAGAKGVTGLGIGLVVLSGIAEFLIKISEFWEKKASRIVLKLKDEEIESGVMINEQGMSKGLKRLLQE